MAKRTLSLEERILQQIEEVAFNDPIARHFVTGVRLGAWTFEQGIVNLIQAQWEHREHLTKQLTIRAMTALPPQVIVIDPVNNKDG